VEYGYRKVGSGRLNRAGREIMLIEPDPAEQAVCELIHELRADGHGVTAIRRRLEAAGHRNRVGTPITCKQVYRVLARPQRCEAAESAA
jgi:hypothetical protein